MAGAVREMKAKIGREITRLLLDRKTWSLVTSLITDDLVLIAESE